MDNFLQTKTNNMRQLFCAAMAVLLLSACSDSPSTLQQGMDISGTRKLEKEELVSRGQYLATVGGCNDCHSPKIFGPQGFHFDSSKLLSGHPANSPLPQPDSKALQPGYWYLAAPDLTAWVGPWGMSFAANLTPDTATGLGNWTEDNFIQAMRKGKHMGMDNGRPIMPPMPWKEIAKMTDEDLEAVFAYLKSLPAINNTVPAPTPPNQVAAGQ